jgi:hypothetical protein
MRVQETRNLLRIAQQECYWLYEDNRKAARELIRRLGSIAHSHCWGVCRGDEVRHANRGDAIRAAMSLSWQERAIALRRLERSARMLWSHLSAHPNRRTLFLWYVNKPLRDKEGYVQLVNIDIDNHSGAPHEEVQVLQGRIGERIDYVYWEPSTSGTGLHGYCLIRSPSASSALAFWDPAEKACSKLAVGLSVSVELRGRPPRLDGSGELLSMGTLAKFPRPQSEPELLNCLSALDYIEQDSACLARLGSASSPSPLSPPSNSSISTDLIVGTLLPPKTVHQPGEAILKAIKEEQDGKVRRNRFAWYYLRVLAPQHPSPEDCNRHYETLGVNRNNVDARRLSHFREALEYWSSRITTSLWTFEEALTLVKSVIGAQGVSQTIQTAKPNYTQFRPFCLNEVAAVLYCLTTTVRKTYSDPSKANTFGRDCCLKSSEQMEVEGYQVRRIDNKRFKVIMDLLESRGLIVCLDRGYIVGGSRKGRCRKYDLGPKHPLSKGPT